MLLLSSFLLPFTFLSFFTSCGRWTPPAWFKRLFARVTTLCFTFFTICHDYAFFVLRPMPTRFFSATRERFRLPTCFQVLGVDLETLFFGRHLTVPFDFLLPHARPCWSVHFSLPQRLIAAPLADFLTVPFFFLHFAIA